MTERRCSRLVVSAGKPSARSNRIWWPNTLSVPVPVRSLLVAPSSGRGRGGRGTAARSRNLTPRARNAGRLPMYGGPCRCRTTERAAARPGDQRRCARHVYQPRRPRSAGSSPRWSRPCSPDGGARPRRAPSASPPTWSTTATTASSSAVRRGSRRPPPTPRRTELLRAVLEAVGDRATSSPGSAPTTPRTASSCAAGRAAKAGAHGAAGRDAVLQQATAGGAASRHFTAVADATELPVMLYDIPGRTGIAIHTETLLRLAEHPRIVAVKDAKGDLFAGEPGDGPQTDLAYYSGDDAAQPGPGSPSAPSASSQRRRPRGRRPRTPRWSRAVDAGDLRRAPARCTAELAARGRRRHDPHPGRDHGQGRAAASSGVHRLGRRCRLPLVEAHRRPGRRPSVRDGLRPDQDCL